MHHKFALSTLVLVGLLVFGGCPRSASPDAENAAPPPVWVEKDIDHHGSTIALGFRGGLTDDGVEPIAAITRDGQPVAGAMVFVRLVPAGGEAATGASVDEVATLYEPASEPAPALYTPGRLPVPAGQAKPAAQFRIVLPDAADELTQEIPLP